ncbi:SCP2 sterol-binding domain-containing protein [Paroceanicella profunda]|uniref:SCP2 sterol-binding domain-containing protein n=1 Tax=Paroceanicella profunda TaxID=2579971 RepID=A0A5B8FW40_9RHOB|nr:SCP2 sterol-binding domain-containing protein [Paroceanicella profunda]QDL90719.1 SCP2 sterol-binding domain-containing protein [Paroceanicella profunda]
MSEMVKAGVKALRKKVGDRKFDGSVRFVIRDEGSIRIDENGVSIDDSDAEVTLTASVDTFRGIIEGKVKPATAFMTGRLKVDGSMGTAMKLAGLLG